MTDQLLDIEVRLLVLRYGRGTVLSALEQLPNEPPAYLLRQAASLVRSAKTKRPRKKPPLLTELVEAEFKERPDLLEPLRTLARGFENRTFLPNLRDVQRFLARSDEAPRQLKSRAAAAPHVLRILSKMPPTELASFAAREERSGESDFELLSRAIMGPAKE